MSIPNNITKEHLEQGLQKLRVLGIEGLSASTKFDVLYKGERFPPKELLRVTNWIANGYELRYFAGGDESNNFLINRELTVVLKGTEREIVLNYTKKLREGRNEEELFVSRTSEILDVDSEKFTNDIENSDLKSTDSIQVIKARIGQSIFKKALLRRECKCALCGVSDIAFLIASHIKPWSASNHKERLDVNNGLLLCPNHDAVFDKGYITFDGNGCIMISKTLNEEMRIFLNLPKSLRISLESNPQIYMEYHRRNIYLDKKTRIQGINDTLSIVQNVPYKGFNHN